MMLQGMSYLTTAKSCIIKHNEFGKQSLEALHLLNEKKMPYNMEEFRLISCKTSPLISLGIVNLFSTGCFIRRLALVEARMNDEMIKPLCEIMEKSRFLIEIDFSWNEFSNIAMRELCIVLAENRKLESINLSWNALSVSERK